ncbi:MAG: Rdx family protein [Alicyclobacillus sp.]|nr:Rdx family protein [Alicyclobacillus sp.]
MKAYHPKIAELVLVPSSGGVFEVTVGGKLIFSKKELNRFPEECELRERAGQVLA